MVQFFRFQRRGGWILNNDFFAVSLNERFATDGIMFVLLHSARACIREITFRCLRFYFIKRRTFHRIGDIGIFCCGYRISCAENVMHHGDGFTVSQSFRNFRNLMFAHTKHQKIGIGIHQNRRANCVVPIVIVSKAAKRSFQSANTKRNISEKTTDGFAINSDCSVGTFSGNAACRIVVIAAFSLCGGIVRYHGVDIAAVDEKGKFGFSETKVIVIILRLRKDTDVKTSVFQNTGDDCCSEAGMVNIGIACNQNDVGRVPTARFHILFSYWKESHSDSFLFIVWIV